MPAVAAGDTVRGLLRNCFSGATDHEPSSLHVFVSDSTGSGYNLIDELTSMTAPAGTMITIAYNQMGGPEGVNGQTSASPSKMKGFERFFEARKSELMRIQYASV